MSKGNNNLFATISFKIHASLNQKINEKVVSEGKGMRGKGQWIREAIENFLDLPDFPELVSLADGYEDADYVLTAKISKSLSLRVEQAVIPIRKEYPEIEGVKSKIFRTAIIQRLIRVQ